jgi:hypothetical protein
MTSTPKSAKTREEGPFKIVAGKSTVKSSEPTATHKGGVPILYATWQLMTDATSLSDWIDQVHRAVRTKHPDVADQIKTLERRLIEIPDEPQEPETPERGSDQEVVEMYKIKVQIYLSQMQVHAKALMVYQTKIEKEENNEKACASEILAYVSDPLIQKVKQDIPELDICSDIPRIITALKSYRSGQDQYLSHAMIKMQPTENLFHYHKRYVESMRRADEGGAQPFDDDLEAIKFVESLLPEIYGEWQMALVNREHDTQASGQGASPWPKTVGEAYEIAAARLTPYGKSKSFDIHSPSVSTINKAIGRQADSEGRGGGTRRDATAHEDEDSPPFKPYKTHSAKPERANDEECYICEGAFNYLTKDKRHFPKYCPFVSIASKDKKALMTKLLHSNDDREASTEVAKTSTANKIAKRQGYSRFSDSEDDEDNSYGVIMGTADR